MKDDFETKVLRAIVTKRGHYKNRFRSDDFWEGWLACEHSLMIILQEVEE